MVGSLEKWCGAWRSGGEPGEVEGSLEKWRAWRSGEEAEEVEGRMEKRRRAWRGEEEYGEVEQSPEKWRRTWRSIKVAQYAREWLTYEIKEKRNKESASGQQS